MAPPVRVLVVDDHLLIRIGLAFAIRGDPGFTVCGEASTGAQAIERYRALRPDVVMMDLRLPDLSGVQVTEAIRREFPDAKIIIISAFAAEEEVYAAVAAGARSYILKTIAPEDLVGVIRKVAAGQRHIPSEIAACLVSHNPALELTSRELEVLRLMIRGSRNRSIAHDLGISESTVKAHVGSILVKLGVPDRTAAVAAALQRGLITLD